MYLAHAARSREFARDAINDNLREFHERMEASWMNLAASTAFTERVDLFLHTVASRFPPCDICPRCARPMRMAAMEADPVENVYTFECKACGASKERKVRT